MPRCVLKLDRERDAYALFSTVVDGFVSDVMTRDEMFDHLKREDRATPDELVEARLVRADLTGTSSKDGDYGFDDGPILFLNGGNTEEVIPRNELYDYATAEQTRLEAKQ